MSTGVDDDVAEKSPLVLSRDTLMPIGVVVSLLVGAWWIGARMSDVQHEVALLRRDLSQIQTTAADSITRREWRAWVMLFRSENPTLKVPELPG